MQVLFCVVQGDKTRQSQKSLPQSDMVFMRQILAIK